MIALSSSSIGYDYQLLFILYHGKPLFSVTVISAYSSTVKKKGYVALGILHLLSFW